MRVWTGPRSSTARLSYACLLIALTALVAGCAGSTSSTEESAPAQSTSKAPPRAELRGIGLEFFTEFDSPHWQDAYRLFARPIRLAGDLERDHQTLARRHLLRPSRVWVVGSTVYVRAGRYDNSVAYALKVARRQHGWKIVIYQVTYRHPDGSAESARINAS